MEYPAHLWKTASKEKGSGISKQLNSNSTEENSMKVSIVTPKGTETDVPMKEKVFSTGTRGFIGSGKVMDGNKKFQINFQMYEVGSKPGSKKK